jgi:hypothetical protein
MVDATPPILGIRRTADMPSARRRAAAHRRSGIDRTGLSIILAIGDPRRGWDLHRHNRPSPALDRLSIRCINESLQLIGCRTADNWSPPLSTSGTQRRCQQSAKISAVKGTPPVSRKQKSRPRTRRRGLRPPGRISPDGQKSTASAPIEMPKALPNQATILQPPATPEDVTVSPSVNNPALQQSAGSKHRAISSRARAEVPFRGRDRNAARRPGTRPRPGASTSRTELHRHVSDLRCGALN